MLQPTMKIYVINLQDAHDRWRHADQQFQNAGLSAERMNAVDGRLLSDSGVEEVYDARRNRKSYFSPLHRGELGCFLSHRSAWQQVRDGCDDYGLIVEDDIEILGPLREFLAEIEEHRPHADLIKLDKPGQGSCFEHLTLACGYQLHQPAQVPLDAAAYLLSRRGAEKLMTALEKIYMPVDVHMQFWWQSELNIWCVDRPLVGQEALMQRASTLKKRKQPVGWMDKIRREIRRPWFRVRLRFDSATQFRRKLTKIDA